MLAKAAGRLLPALRLALCLTVGAALVGTAQAETFKGAKAAAEATVAAQHLGKVQTLSADFDMLTPGGVNEGKIFVDRQRDAIRIEFAPPLNHLVLVLGPVVHFVGGNGTQIQTATNGTPFAFLMNPEQALRDSVDVLQVEKKNADLMVAVAERGKVADGQIMLQFRGQGDWRLMEWGMFDQKGGFSQTKLRNVQTGVDLSASLFKAPEREQPE